MGVRDSISVNIPMAAVLIGTGVIVALTQDRNTPPQEQPVRPELSIVYTFDEAHSNRTFEELSGQVPTVTPLPEKTDSSFLDLSR